MLHLEQIGMHFMNKLSKREKKHLYAEMNTGKR